MQIRRRTFFKVGAAATAVAVAGRSRPASAATAAKGLSETSPAVLVDTTRCVGCRACEAACSEANRLAEPVEGDDVFAAARSTTPANFTVVNRREAGARERFVKTQCMHCVDPACASACLTRAIEKTPEGPVVYHPSRCMGCRYCMVACPFDVPKFEYDKASPFIRKCTFCAERQAAGHQPACTSVCPSGALTFGKRGELLHEARNRLYGQGAKYEPHIYGEHEAGGTSWLYISDLPLDKIGLPNDLLTQPYSSLSQPALAAVPFVLTLWPPLLMGLYTFSQRRANNEHDAAPGEGEEVRHA